MKGGRREEREGRRLEVGKGREEGEVREEKEEREGKFGESLVQAYTLSTASFREASPDSASCLRAFM